MDVEERWDDPVWFRQWMAEIESDPGDGDDEDDAYLAWLAQDRQRRIDAWDASFAVAGIIPPSGWEEWVT